MFASILLTSIMYVGSLQQEELKDGLIKSRIEENAFANGEYKQLSAAATHLIAILNDISIAENRMPTYSAVRKVLVENKTPLATLDRLHLYNTIGSIQRPLIGRGELAELYRSQRTAFDPIRIEYEVQHLVEEGVSQTELAKGNLKESNVFVSKRPYLYFDTSKERDKKLQVKYTLASTGNLLRTNEKTGTSGDSGTIASADGRKRFFRPGNPLMNAKLIDSVIDLDGSKHQLDDIAKLLTTLYVYETTEQVDGVECIVIGRPMDQYYCSVKHNYAVVKTINGALDYDTNLQRFVPAENTETTLNSDFEEVGKIGSLPRRSESRLVQNGNTVAHYVTKVEAINFPAEVEDKFFIDIIPNGAPVSDMTKNLVYHLNSADIDEAINASPGLKRPMSRPWLLILTGNVIALVILIWALSRKKKPKKN